MSKSFASRLAIAATAIATAGFAVNGAAATSAHGQTIAALVNGSSLVWIDAKAKKVTGWVDLDGGAKLVGIDVRPADKMLYGLTKDGAVVTIDHKTGKWTKKSQLTEKLPDGAMFSVDFNPAADRLRVIGSDGTSLRINVDDGKTIVDGRLRYADADANKGKSPRVIAAGYSNSFAGTKETALYDIDVANGVFVKQAPPNDGILNTIGSLGVKTNGHVAFDILSDSQGGNSAWMVMGDTLYAIDLATGAAKSHGKIAGLKGTVGDIAILPTM
jgi:hypothetical protein